MPYFERLPYIEMIAKAASEASNAAAIPAPPPLMERAAAILKEESRALPPSGPPAYGIDAASYPVFQAPAAKAGEQSVVAISIVNDSDDSVAWSLTPGDLVSPSGGVIPRANVMASPATATAPARGSVDVRIQIQVPPGSAGDYAGVLTCSDATPGLLLVTAV